MKFLKFLFFIHIYRCKNIRHILKELIWNWHHTDEDQKSEMIVYSYQVMENTLIWFEKKNRQYTGVYSCPTSSFVSLWLWLYASNRFGFFCVICACTNSLFVSRKVDVNKAVYLFLKHNNLYRIRSTVFYAHDVFLYRSIWKRVLWTREMRYWEQGTGIRVPDVAGCVRVLGVSGNACLDALLVPTEACSGSWEAEGLMMYFWH